MASPRNRPGASARRAYAPLRATAFSDGYGDWDDDVAPPARGRWRTRQRLRRRQGRLLGGWSGDTPVWAVAPLARGRQQRAVSATSRRSMVRVYARSGRRSSRPRAARGVTSLTAVWGYARSVKRWMQLSTAGGLTPAVTARRSQVPVDDKFAGDGAARTKARTRRQAL